MDCNSFTKEVKEIAKSKEALLQAGVDIREAKALLTEASLLNKAVRDNEIGLSSTINSDGELIMTRTENSLIDNVFLEDGKLILKIEE